MIRIHSLLAAGALAALASPIDAHHSTAMYDDDNPIDIRGTIVRVEWVNPHARVYVAHENGTEWAVELDPPVLLEQRGWDARAVAIGSVITFNGAPAKSGASMLRGLGATLSDGRQLGTWSRP